MVQIEETLIIILLRYYDFIIIISFYYNSGFGYQGFTFGLRVLYHWEIIKLNSIYINKSYR